MRITAKIKKPSLILDPEKARRNIRRMAAKAEAGRVVFRPHFKTHQSVKIGEYFRDRSLSAITVSSVDMACYFADGGWDDITIAFPANLRQIEEMNALAEKIKLNLLVESMDTVQFLIRNLRFSVGIWIKIDVGYGRTGVRYSDSDLAADLVREMEGTKHLDFKGLLTHSGHTYHAESRDRIRSVYRDTVEKLEAVQQALIRKGLPKGLLSIGDTPACSVVDDFQDVDEIRPGNFVFYDVMQLMLGSCSAEDIAVAIACPVVAKHAERGELVVYGGAVHLSKEYVTTQDGTKVFGLVVPETEDGWGAPVEKAYVSSLTQEHGVIKAGKEQLKKIRIGDLVLVLPVHSCLAVDLLREYYVEETGSEKVTTLKSDPDRPGCD